MDKICPIMSGGWLGNKFAAKMSGTFAIQNMVPCEKEKCQFWVERSGTHKESGTDWSWEGCGLVEPKE